MNAGQLGPGTGGVPHLLVTTGAASRGTLLKMEAVPAATSLALKTSYHSWEVQEPTLEL